MTLLCKNCKNVKMVPCRPGLGGAIVPRSCDHAPQVKLIQTIYFSLCFLFILPEFWFCMQPGEEPCPIDPWIIVPDKSKYVDQQTLKLQENPEVRCLHPKYIKIFNHQLANECSS